MLVILTLILGIGTVVISVIYNLVWQYQTTGIMLIGHLLAYRPTTITIAIGLFILIFSLLILYNQRKT